MSDPLTWSPISLGRWFGTAVRVHILLIAFVVVRLIASAGTPAAEGRLAHLSHTACWLGCCWSPWPCTSWGMRWRRPGSTATRTRSISGRWATWSARRSRCDPGEHFLVALAGPLTQRGAVPGDGDRPEAVRRMRRSSGGRSATASPTSARRASSKELARPLGGAWMLGWFAYWNWVLLLVNLIPALPFDGGRAVRACDREHVGRRVARQLRRRSGWRGPSR